MNPSKPVLPGDTSFEYTTIAGLDDTSPGEIVSVIGVVASYKPARKTRGKDFVTSITLCDSTRSLVSSGLMINIFRENIADMPTFTRPDYDPGDDKNPIVMVCRNMKLQRYGNNIQGLSRWDTSLCETQGNRLQHIGKPSTLTADERRYATELSKYWTTRGGTAGAMGVSAQQIGRKHVTQVDAAPAMQPGTRPTAKISELQFDRFYDVYAQVLKAYPVVGPRGECEIYVSDFTENALVKHWRQGENTRHTFPEGRFVLQVTLYPPHSQWARQNVLMEGEFVLLRNLRAKRNRDGLLEANLHGDRENEEKVNIEKVHKTDAVLVNIHRRQRALEAALKRQAEGEARELKRKQREEEEAERERKKPAPNVVTVHPHIAFTLPGDVPDPNPERPRKYRMHVRVIGFQPRDLAHFRVQWCDRCQSTLSRVYEACPRCLFSSAPALPDSDASDDEETTQVPTPTPSQSRDRDGIVTDSNGKKWVWHFGLLVEGTDGIARPVSVSGADAIELLGGLKPSCLSTPNGIDRLREILFMMWGNLQEMNTAAGMLEANLRAGKGKGKKKKAIAEQKPKEVMRPWFECCTQEMYMDGRRHRLLQMFGTRIV
ncbi:hypothetical protein SAICODRAFT_24193 [Saitoella complicata NRRL Y-17804]|nr:uncharacterized protein SAICODRAFT_24193 [Saitoella complicata NRRL Y-17804]ODQ54401.1 hypothetical protein SAICODRAFT_24193 [Saitoella complicata NRRL Y-17804]